MKALFENMESFIRIFIKPISSSYRKLISKIPSQKHISFLNLILSTALTAMLAYTTFSQYKLSEREIELEESKTKSIFYVIPKEYIDIHADTPIGMTTSFTRIPTYFEIEGNNSGAAITKTDVYTIIDYVIIDKYGKVDDNLGQPPAYTCSVILPDFYERNSATQISATEAATSATQHNYFEGETENFRYYTRVDGIKIFLTTIDVYGRLKKYYIDFGLNDSYASSINDFSGHQIDSNYELLYDEKYSTYERAFMIKSPKTGPLNWFRGSGGGRSRPICYSSFQKIYDAIYRENNP